MIKTMRALLPILMIALVACGVEPAPPASTATPTPEIITEAEAVALAMEDASEWLPGLTPIDNPRNPIARLVTVDEYREIIGQPSDSMFGIDDLTWAGQLEGYSESEGPPPTSWITEYSHAVFAYDARTGAMAHVSWGTRRTEPLFFYK